jgi:regulator of replication initiation timing
MVSRLSETERSMAFQRLEEAEKRIAELEAGIQRLKEKGLATVEAERLLRLTNRSRLVMRRHLDRLSKDQT